MTKTVTYTPEMVSEMITTYKAATDEKSRYSAVKTLAEKFGMSVAAIRGKLVFEKVYIPKNKTSKSTRTNKEQYAKNLAKIIGNEELTNSFKNLTVDALTSTINYIYDLKLAVEALENNSTVPEQEKGETES